MVFDQVRSLGASVLASAGVLSIIIGFAAQRTIANLFAGFQLALTQPIRLDDVVIVENEWGRIEEVTLTYVVVRIWDMRRLIVPLSYFIEKPFQNWTRSRSDLLGTVFIHADYTIPVDAVREELKRIVAQSSLWDGQVCVLQVTNATERTVELRALASAPDASKAWDLRCEIREKLIAFVQQNFPESLPRLRAEVEPAHAAPRESNARENPIGFSSSKV
jgi:small-conductance mechanosensitive channel